MSLKKYLNNYENKVINNFFDESDIGLKFIKTHKKLIKELLFIIIKFQKLEN